MASKSMAGFLAYRRPLPGTQPNHLHPPYLSSVKRAPTKPLIYLPHTLSEITGPTFRAGVCGRESLRPDAAGAERTAWRADHR